MAQEYVGGGGTKKPTSKSPTTGRPVVQPKKPVAPRKPLPSPVVNRSKKPSSPSYKKPTPKPAPKKKTVVAPKPVPKVVPASGKKPAPPKPAPKIPNGKMHDIYKDTHKNVPKTTPKPPAKAPAKAPAKPPAKPPVKAPAKPPAKAPAKPPATPPAKAPAKPPTVQAPKKPATPPVTKPSPVNKKLDDLWKQANGYKAQIDALMKDGAFTYNPETDEAYKAIQALATKNASAASVGAMEDMNDRGILNSTITSDRMGQIQQSAQDAVTAQIPQLQQAAYGKHLDKVKGLMDLWNSTNDLAENEQGFTEDKRRWDLGYDQQLKEWEESKRQWEEEFGYQKIRDGVEDNYRDREFDQEDTRLQLSELENISRDRGYYNDQLTQSTIADALKTGSAEAAKEYLRKNGYSIVVNGGNLTDIINGLDKYYKGFKDQVSKEDSENPFG